MGFTLTPGNNVSINLEPDTRAETERLFEALSNGGKIERLKCPRQEMFWGGYFFCSLTDRFGVRWMFNSPAKPDQT
jgi:PhnB protein